MARRNRRKRLREGCQTFSLKAGVPSRPCPHLRRLGIRTRLRFVATHGISRRQYNSPGSRKRQRQVRSRHHSNDTGMVWVRLVHNSDHWLARHDIEYQSAGSADGRLRMMATLLFEESSLVFCIGCLLASMW